MFHVLALDSSAARRALVALEVARGAAAAVELAAWPQAWWSQLERCAEEGGRQLSATDANPEQPGWAGDLPAAAAPLSHLASDGEVWARLARPSGAAKRHLEQARDAGEAARREAALCKLRELGRRLREIDPSARLQAAPSSRTPGAYALVSVRFESQEFQHMAEVDANSDVPMLLKAISSSCCDC